MASPVPAKFKITTTYHKPGSWWSCGYHTGVDFACPIGTEVYAVQDGTVQEAKMGVTWGGAYGNAIIISHKDANGNVYHAIYAHLSQIQVKKGQKVTAGMRIGLSGNTGNSSGPHLHFEVRVAPFRYGNKDVNPEILIAGAVKKTLKAKISAKKSDKRPSLPISKEYPGATVDPGDKGDPVKVLQEIFGLPVSGVYDAALKKEIVAWQKKNPNYGAADGVVGPKTWKALVK